MEREDKVERKGGSGASGGGGDPKKRLSCKVAHMTEWRVNQHEHPAGDKKRGCNGSEIMCV